MAKLGEVCLLKAGKFVSANDISPEYNKGLYPCFGGNGIRGYVADYTHDGEFPLIGRQGALCGNVNLASGKFHATEHAVVVQPKIEMNVHWLYYALNAMNLGQYATGAAQPGLAVSKLETLSIEIPNISEQNKIAQTLYKVEQLVNFRKQQLAKLDELVKARFVEMFGNPIRNDKHFVQKTGKSLFCFSSGKFLQEEKRFQHGFPVYGGNGITWYTDIPLVKKPTIIIGRVGAYCGNVRMVNVPVWITDNAIYIKEFKTRELNLHFLLMLMKYMKFSNYADYSGQPKITQKPLETLIYIVPPLELQNRFAAFVERVDQQKQTVQQSLEKLELMKKALMQEYFG